MGSKKPASILLVDDHPNNLYVLEVILADLPARLVCATSGEEALRHLLNEDFALIIMDVKMPGLDGYETMALMRKRNRSRHTPIIFLTGSNETERPGMADPAIEYMTKPVAGER